MNFPSISLEKFNALEPQTVANYLRDSHWRENEVVEHLHSIWRLNTVSDGEYVLLLPLNPEIPDFSYRMSDVVRVLASVEKRPEAELFNDLSSAAQIAREKGREILNMHLYFPAKSVNPEAPVKKLGKLLISLQDTLDAIGQFESGCATPLGKISQEITDKTGMDVIGIFKGSFGVRFASSPKSEQLDLWEPSLAEIVIDDFITLLNSSSDEQKLKELTAKLQQRSVSRYRQFLLALTHSEADLRVEWGSPNQEKGGTAQLSCWDAWRAIAICDEVEITEPENLSIIGELLAVNSEQKTFRIRDRHEGNIYFGKITDAVFDSGVDLVVVKPPRTYTALIQQTLEERPATGEAILKSKLLNLEPVQTTFSSMNHAIVKP